MAAKLKIENRGDEISKKSSTLKLLSQSQPNFAEMILGWSLPKLCPAFQTSDEDGRHSRSHLGQRAGGHQTQFWKRTIQ
jgi:hypothetical protein